MTACSKSGCSKSFKQAVFFPLPGPGVRHNTENAEFKTGQWIEGVAQPAQDFPILFQMLSQRPEHGADAGRFSPGNVDQMGVAIPCGEQSQQALDRLVWLPSTLSDSRSVRARVDQSSRWSRKQWIVPVPRGRSRFLFLERGHRSWAGFSAA